MLEKNSRAFGLHVMVFENLWHTDQNIKLKITKKVCKIRLINVFFPKIWNNLQKSAGKNFARVLFGGEGVSKSLAHGPKYQVKNHQQSVQNSAHKRFFPKIWNNLQKSAGENFARVLFAC